MGNSNSSEKPKDNKNNQPTTSSQLQIRNCIRDVRGNVAGSFADLHPNIGIDSGMLISSSRNNWTKMLYNAEWVLWNDIRAAMSII